MRLLQLRSAAALTITAALATAGLAACGPAAGIPAGYCAAPTSRTFTVTTFGQDNRDVNATVGFDAITAGGQKVDLTTGCAPNGYSKWVEINHYVGATGATQASVVHGVVTTRTVRLTNIPANVSNIWVEVWSRAWTGSPCTTCAGAVNTTKYGFANRRAVPVGANITMVLPTTPAYGGSAGSIAGSVHGPGGVAIIPDSVYAWSTLSPDGSKPLQGWGAGARWTGGYRVPALAADQPYVVWVTWHGRTIRLNTYVHAGTQAALSFQF